LTLEGLQQGGAKRRQIVDRLMSGLVYAAVAIAVVPLVVVIGSVVIEGLPALDLSFFTSLPTPPTVGGGGIANAIVGSAIMVALATAISVPIGMGAGIYFSEWPESRLSFVSSFTNDVLAEFPTITLGFFIYIILVLPTRTFSGLAGALALSIIMIPIVARTTEESLKIVPVSLREASMALGIPRWKTILQVVIATGRRGLVTGILLSLARAAGETAPLIFTAFYSDYIPKTLFTPFGSIPYLIYYYSISEFSQWHTLAWGAALILVAFMLVLNLGLKGYIGRRSTGVRAEI
jgi:phosphate transport system permease protein